MWHTRIFFLIISSLTFVCCKRKDESDPVVRKPEGRIIGGSEATPHYWRFMASIQFTDGVHFCGGALITPSWVLTAAHCVDTIDGPSHMRVVLGEHSLLIPEGTEQILGVRSIHMNPFYNIQHPDFTYFLPYDLALLELDKPAVLNNNYVSTIDLPVSCQGFIGQICTILGWGKYNTSLPNGIASEFLQESQVSVLGLDSCRNTWGDFVYYGTVCVYYYGTTPCSGDSGGPLVCLDGYRFVLAGISSWGDQECGNHPSIYSKVSEHLGWIHDVTKMSP